MIAGRAVEDLFDGPGITDAGRLTEVRHPKNRRSRHVGLGPLRRPVVPGPWLRVAGALDLVAPGLMAQQARDVVADLDAEEIAACPQFARRQNGHFVLRARPSCEMSGRLGSALARLAARRAGVVVAPEARASRPCSSDATRHGTSCRSGCGGVSPARVSPVFATAFALLLPAVPARASRGPRFSTRRRGRPSNKALQLTAKGRAPISRGRVWRRTSALRSATVAALAGS